ncbi:FecCD family ABC transporter permease [Miltoncostaea marina]|uniref:FecCD family ABC transporter permease n=1 Tax=Miltoncostaea marina TaxID=2843215 RepID=UPI001C3C416B|nr:iron chelate uptake ABC transporter family permease subunit [Miltoncostaea marina]
MATDLHTAALPPAAPGPARRGPARLAAGLVACLAALAGVLVLGVALGARSVPFDVVVDALVAYDPGVNDQVVVRELRVPRTLIGLAAGAALGLAGAVIQGVTRNPIADPGLLGVNAGAALAVVSAITLLGVSTPAGYVWFAFAGAALAATLVYGIGAVGRDGATPVRLVLVGAAVTAAATSLTTMMLLGDIETLDRYRFWVVGSLVGRDLGTLAAMAPFLAAGAVLALAVGRVLNVIALGDDVARGLGQRLGAARAAAALAVVLLCGAATAVAGPLVFVGLVVPHVARRVTGPDYRWILAYSAVLGPILLIAADVAGRLIARPGEIEAGLVAAFLGAPVMIALVRRAGPARL